MVGLDGEWVGDLLEDLDLVGLVNIRRGVPIGGRAALATWSNDFVESPDDGGGLFVRVLLVPRLAGMGGGIRCSSAEDDKLVELDPPTLGARYLKPAPPDLGGLMLPLWLPLLVLLPFPCPFIANVAELLFSTCRTLAASLSASIFFAFWPARLACRDCCMSGDTA